MNSSRPKSTANGCLERSTLVEFLRGDLSAAGLDSVAQHIAVCELCGAALHELGERPGENPLAERVRHCLELRPIPDDDCVRALESMARAIGAGTAPVHAKQDFSGQSIGPYVVLETVDQGGMGVVYRARQPAVKRDVAVKMLLGGGHASADAVARFCTEAEAVARLQHPFIVHLYHFGEHNGLPYYAMEWVEGGNLSQSLEAGPWPFRAAAELVRDVAAAVAFAHDLKVLHRDLKPSNILLAADGTPKVADFGLAKLLDNDDGRTLSDAVLGTPNYMAPEQAAGRPADIGPHTDVYALGAILYALLTGRPPFQAGHQFETLRRVREEPVTPPGKLRRGLSADLEAICLKCLEKRPSQRYPSAHALGADLRRWLRRERPQAAGGILKRLVRGVRSWRWPIVSCVVLFGAGIVIQQYDSDRVVQQAAVELAGHHPVTLIGETGEPKWFRMRAGTGSCATSLAADGTFAVHAWDLCLIELLPNPAIDRYRFAVRVRHVNGQSVGAVGLYFGHQLYPGEPANIRSFIQLTFNDVSPILEPPVPLFPSATLPTTAAVKLCPSLFSERQTPLRIEAEMPGWLGPRFNPTGAKNGINVGGWHDLAVCVTPAGITAEWDGQTFGVSNTEIAAKISSSMDGVRKYYSADPTMQTLQPSFKTRGSLGLILKKGVASFAAATVTPLDD